MMLRLVVLAGVVSCSPLPQDLTPPAATATHHHHHAAHSRPFLAAHGSPPSAAHFSSAALPSSAAHIEVTHEIRHVTFEVSEEVKEGGGGGDLLTTPGDVPEDDPPIPTATTPPALPDTHHGHLDTSRPQVVRADDVLSEGVQVSHESDEPHVHHPHNNVQEVIKSVDTHHLTPAEEYESVISESVLSHLSQAGGESLVSQPVIRESAGRHGRLRSGESVEKELSVESFEKESVEKEPFSRESVEKHPSLESVEKDPSVESVERESALIESVERELQIESVSVDKDHELVQPAVESGISQVHSRVGGDGSASVSGGGGGAVSGGDAVSVGGGDAVSVGGGDAVSVGGDEDVNAGDEGMTVGGEGASALSVAVGGEGASALSVAVAVGKVHSVGVNDRGNLSNDEVSVSGDDDDAPTPSTSLHHHHHHHHQEKERKGAGEGIVVSEDDEETVDMRKENSSEEKAVKARKTEEETKKRVEGQTEINHNNNNTVKGHIESLSHVAENGRRVDGALGIVPDHVSRAIKVWEGAPEEMVAPEAKRGEEEKRKERKTRPEVEEEEEEEEEVPTFMMDSSAPIDIVVRSQSKGGNEGEAKEVLEASASEVAEEVASRVEEEEEEGSEGEEADHKSRTYIEAPSLAERVEAIARKVPKILRDGLESVVGVGETPPLEDEEPETTVSSGDISSEETLSEEGDEEEETGDSESVEEEGRELPIESPIQPQPSQAKPAQGYTESYEDAIISGENLPDFTVTQEEIPSLAHPEPELLPINSNRGNSGGNPTWPLPPQQEQVSVAAPTSLTPGCIVAIVFGVLVSLVIIGGIGGFVLWQRRTLNRPKALGSDQGYAGSDSLGYLDDQVHVSYVNSQVDSTKGSPEDLISLDMDSDFFLNSLESMTIQNLWPENIRHTKL